jgi:hypothetical protein
MRGILPTTEQIARNHGIAAERERCALLVEHIAELTLADPKDAAVPTMQAVARVLQAAARAIRSGENAKNLSTT